MRLKFASTTLLLATSAALIISAAPLAAETSPARPAISGQPQTGLDIIPLTIISADGKQHDFKVEIARTREQQAHGMMFRTEMAPGTGMLFPYSPPMPVAFWMRNTLIPLDIIFIGRDNRVLNIEARAVPHSEQPRASRGPAMAVLELAGGEAERIGLKPGDQIRWPD